MFNIQEMTPGAKVRFAAAVGFVLALGVLGVVHFSALLLAALGVAPLGHSSPIAPLVSTGLAWAALTGTVLGRLHLHGADPDTGTGSASAPVTSDS